MVARNRSAAPQGQGKTNHPGRGRQTRAALGCVVLSAVGLGLVVEAAGPAPTFTPASGSPFSAGGTYPLGVAVADLNGDGKPDLVSANYSSTGNLGVLLGNGLGSFGTATTFPAGVGIPEDVAVADVNRDGKPDLVCVDRSSGTLAVLLGNGLGSFGAATTFSSGGRLSFAVAVADVNGDGNPDLITTHILLNDLAVLFGDGAGGFAEPVSFLTGGRYPLEVAVSDVNGDGKPDLIAANGSSYDLSVLLGDGLGGFGTPAVFPSGGYGPRTVAAADVNGDGKADLVSANMYSTDLSVLLGNGLGSFGTATTFPTAGSLPRGLAVGDVNGDGKPDLATANSVFGPGGASLSVLVGDGSGGFSAPLSFPTNTNSTNGKSPFAVAMADVNGDGKPDLVAPNYNSHTVAVLLNTVVDATPPTGTPLAVGTSGASNGQAYVPVRLRDTGSGVKQAQLTANSSNVHFEYPLGTVQASPFTFPTPLTDVTIYAVKNTNAKSRVELKVTDTSGNQSVVDPIVATLELKKSGQLTRTYKQIPQAERYVRLQNGTPGFKNARLWINGKVVSKGNLTDGQTVDLDVVEWLKPGTRNTAKITAAGPKGAKAILTIGDVATGNGAALRALSGGTVNVEFSR